VRAVIFVVCVASVDPAVGQNLSRKNASVAGTREVLAIEADDPHKGYAEALRLGRETMESPPLLFLYIYGPYDLGSGISGLQVLGMNDISYAEPDC
jgi:hypothetical protein